MLSNVPPDDSVILDFIRRLGALDKRFAAEYSADLANADIYPYGVMAFLEAYLCRQCKNSIDHCRPLLISVMNLIESGLRAHYDELQNIVEVAFIEKLFYDNNALFAWMLEHSGSLLAYEFLAFWAKERAYRLINAIREVFGQTAPNCLDAITRSEAILQRLEVLGVPIEQGNALDPWKHPYQYYSTSQQDGENRKQVICVTSLASCRGYGRDIQVIG
jgi:hypothetical protein